VLIRHFYTFIEKIVEALQCQEQISAWSIISELAKESAYDE